MLRAVIFLSVLGLIHPSLSGQSVQEATLAFEVASVKPHPDGSSIDRIGIEERARQITIENLSLRALIAIAYGTKTREQVHGPGWIDTTSFDIVAKPPNG